jgi:hypothetical protein
MHRTQSMQQLERAQPKKLKHGEIREELVRFSDGVQLRDAVLG